MALFNLQKIGAAAAGHQTYLRGISCYNSGAVHEVTRSCGGIYAEILTAEVDSCDGRGLSYHVEACFDDDGELVHCECGCPVFDPACGACRHIVAALVHKYYADMVSGMQTAVSVRPSAVPTARTDEIARRMIDRYMEQQAAIVAAHTAPSERQVRLLAHLRVNGQSAQLSFSLYASRDYVIRDLRAFAQAMANHETVSYGRSLSLFHHPDSFFAEDRPLLRFLLGQIPKSVRGEAGGHAVRELTLSPVALDAFFSVISAVEGYTLLCRVYGEARRLTLLKEDPALCLSVRRAKDRNGYLLQCDTHPVTLEGNRRRYVLTEKYLYACSPAYGDRTGALLDALQAARGQLFVSDADMPLLCAGALKATDGLITLIGDVQQLESFLPTPMEAELYLDAPARDTVAAKLLFCYRDRRINAFLDETLDGVTRDTLAEYRLRLLVRQQFDRVDETDGRLLLTADDGQLYRFMTEGIARLREKVAVYATDRVRAIGMAPPVRVSVGVRMKSDLLDFTMELQGIDQAELIGVLDAYREKRSYHRLKNGRFLNLSDPALQGLYALSEGLSFNRNVLSSGHAELPAYRAMYLDRVLRSDSSIQLRRDDGFRRLVRGINAAADSDFSPPASLRGVLRNYQETGFRWLKTMQECGFGGILADDMGLGKTLEMISVLLDAKERGEELPSLVICPASLIFNWQSEFARFAPSLRVLAVTGDAATRAQLLEDLRDVDVVITSYDLLKRDRERYRPHRFAFHVLDEAQYIKNASTHNARAVKAINSRWRFALTGTPIENRLSELWSIFDFLMPGFLYSYARFRDRLERPIVRDGDEQALLRLDRLVSPFILRRLKSEVLHELPPKHESVVSVPLCDEQRTLYLATAAQLRDELTTNGLSRNHMTVLSMLTRLRQICCSPSLCYENYRGGSAKTEVCMELLREAIAGGHKVLLFSQFAAQLTLLHEPLKAAGMAFYELRGSTPKEERAALVEKFNKDDTPVFLISLKAGGTGLNLTGADVVIHFDPWWNLSAQNQATDRAHRIGQEHPVQVYKLIAGDTVEEKILAMQEQKQALADAVVHEGEGLLSGLSAGELIELL